MCRAPAMVHDVLKDLALLALLLGLPLLPLLIPSPGLRPRPRRRRSGRARHRRLAVAP